MSIESWFFGALPQQIFDLLGRGVQCDVCRIFAGIFRVKIMLRQKISSAIFLFANIIF